MSSNYYKMGRDFTENLANTLFNNAGLKSRLNNKTDLGAVDIIMNEETKIDVQFSNNFARYRDFRLDFISAFTYVSKVGSIYGNNIFDVFERNKKATISKKGKYFENPNYLDYIIVFFYNSKLETNNLPPKVSLENLKDNLIPDYTLIVKSQPLINYVMNNSATLFNEIKINDKKGNYIIEEHESAFIPIKVQKILNNINTTDYLWTNSLPSNVEIFNFLN